MNLRRVRRGDWDPARSRLLVIIQTVLVGNAVARGIDYLRRADVVEELTRLEEQVRGVLLLFAVLVIVVGMGWWCGRVLAIGHLMAMAIYASVGVEALLVTGLGPGFRLPVSLMGAALIHGAFGVHIFGSLRRRETLPAVVSPD